MNKGPNLVGGDTFPQGAIATNASAGFPKSTGPVDGTHYKLVSTAEVDALLAKGCNSFRVVFGWEAMQPTPKAPIPGAGNFGTYFAKVKALVDYATGKGARVLLDIHGGVDTSFAAYYGTKVGATYAGYPVKDLLVDLWTKVATAFRDNANVDIGITNEPHDIAATTWFDAVQAVVTAVRAAGFKGYVWAPGVNWTHASTWVSSGSAAGFAAVKDPLRKLGFQVHEYADANAGGGATDIVSDTILIDRIKPSVDWARANGAKMWLTEVGFPATDSKARALWLHLMAYLRANADVVAGWSWWAYGPPAWWGGFRFALNPKTVGGADSPQMDLIEADLAAVEVPPDPKDALIADLKAQVLQLAVEATTANGRANDAIAKAEALETELAEAARALEDARVENAHADDVITGLHAALAEVVAAAQKGLEQ